MMGLTWFILGFLSAGSVIFYRELSKRYRLKWILLCSYGAGVVLVLFSIAWSVGAVLEGVPRAGSMGMLLFGLPGIVVLTLTLRNAFNKPEKVIDTRDRLATEPATTLEDSVQVQPVLKLPQFSPRVNTGLRYAAYLSLVIAFIAGLATSGQDYEAMVQAKFEGMELKKINDNPVVFQVNATEGKPGEYILITEGQGYGGPFVLGIRIKEDAKVHEVIPLSDKETPAFLNKIKEANYRDQFIGRGVTDNFIVGDDIDAVSGATVTTMAATQAVRNGAHLAAIQYFKLEPSWKSVPWKFGLDEILIIVLFGLAFVPRVSQKKPWKYVYMAGCVAIVGFYLNAAVSVGSLSGLLMGYIPNISEHLSWWILVVGTVLAILILGKNVYCFRICPFYGVEFFLNKISGSRWNPSPEVLRRSRSMANFLLWLCLMIIFIGRLPAAGAYEPFAMMFSLEGVGIQWYILPLALIGSFFMSTFWCRFFCPAGNMFSHFLKLRKFVFKRFKEKTDQGGTL